MDVVYGMRDADENDKYITIAERGAAVFSEVAAPGRYLAELFPALAYVPAWLPGARFKRDAAKWAQDMTALREVPWSVAVNTTVYQYMVRWRYLHQLCSLAGTRNSETIHRLNIDGQCISSR